MMKALIAGVAATALFGGAACAQQTDAGAPAAASEAQEVGLGVYASNREQIGVIEEIVAAEDGSQMAVISVGAYLGLGAKRIAVPTSALTLKPDGEGYTISLSAEEIEAAPEYSPE